MRNWNLLLESGDLRAAEPNNRRVFSVCACGGESTGLRVRSDPSVANVHASGSLCKFKLLWAYRMSMNARISGRAQLSAGRLSGNAQMGVSFHIWT